MIVDFARAFVAEWRKQRRSAVARMVWAGALFTPAVLLVARALEPSALPALHADPRFWELQRHAALESVAIFLLPMGAVLTSALAGQVEFRHQAWKLVRVLPMPASTVYAAKLAIVLVRVLQFLVLFEGATFASAHGAALLAGVEGPVSPWPWREAARDVLRYFVATLPIVAMQTAIALRCANFLVPVGVGFLAWVGTLAALPWRWGWLSPFAYPVHQYLATSGTASKVAAAPVGLHTAAWAWFAVLALLGAFVFARQRQTA